MSPALFSLFSGACLLANDVVRAQSVDVTLLEQESESPIAGAMVVLVDSAGLPLSRDLTDAAGIARLRASAERGVRILAERIGYRTIQSIPFDVPQDGSLTIDLEVPIDPIELEELKVSIDAVCAPDPSASYPASVIWGEVRKALERVAWTGSREEYEFDVEVYERRLGRDRQIQLEEKNRLTVSSIRPFRTIPAEVLVEEGFIRAERGDTLYFGPDAEVLLSDDFARTHCFQAVVDQQSQRIGLDFEPIDPGSSDIAGVLWLDQESAALLDMRFHYTGPIAEAVEHPHEGQISFQQLPGGGWIVETWWIRLPVFSRRLVWEGRSMPIVRARRRLRLSGYVERGGVVKGWERVGRPGP